MRRFLIPAVFAAALGAFGLPARPAVALDRPWIGDVFFYWYTWDYDRELGGWMQGVHNTPLGGYYDSRTLADNRRSLWLASEWGMTHHFMDYWTPDWKGEGGRMREAIVMEAAESLRKAGYDVWMSYYQDGQNFEMAEFSKNVSEKRDVHQWLRDFARSPVWPKIDGQPLQLVYARNGSPKVTLDHPGFRRFLKARYGDAAALNRAWKTGYRDFDEIEMSTTARGHLRADSIAYQFDVWQREWQKLNGLVKEQFGLPGMRASFDVGYGPFLDFGFGEFARVLGGPHSYAGIFDQPHHEDAQRYIQASVARKYNTVFFDHLKNYYHDWDIRVPGMAMLAEPCHFDRFWVGALARRSEALLHLSWNEWWEGSNLEPSHEFGKKYCEKNLFYATLMKLCFDSIHRAEREAQVGVLLNEWRFAGGAQLHEELYDTIQTLRRLCVPFDLVPDRLVTDDQLERFRLIVVPAHGCGLGTNGQNEPIAGVLRRWLEKAPRRLIVSADPSLDATFGVREGSPPAAAAAPGPDLNVFVDVGAEGDGQFLRGGASHRESWGGVVKPGEPRSTFRWTPATGGETSFFLPASPNRDHVLRLVGRTLAANKVTAVVNGREAGTADLPAGDARVEIKVPAAVVGPTPLAAVGLRYAQQHVPSKLAPAVYPGEMRVCNLAMEWLQWSTANVPADTRTQNYTVPKDAVRLSGPLFAAPEAKEISVPVQPRRYFDSTNARVLSRLRGGDVPRDLAVTLGPSEVLYVNGPLSEMDAAEYWLPLIFRWAKVEFPRYAEGEHVMVNRLRAGDTDFVVAFNEDITGPRKLRLSIPARGLPLSEAGVLSRDGRPGEALAAAVEEIGGHVAADQLGYYGVYQFAFSPVRVRTPDLALQPGEEKAFPVEVTNLTDRPIRGSIQAGSILPTIFGPPVPVELGPAQSKRVDLPIRAADAADWGRKTIWLELEFIGRRAVVLRELTVLRPTEIQLASTVLDAARPALRIRAAKSPHGRTAPLAGARLTFRGRSVSLPTIAEGEEARVVLPAVDLATSPGAGLHSEKLRIDLAGPRAGEAIEREVFLAAAPKDPVLGSEAAAVLAVFNPRSKPLAGQLVSAAMPAGPGPWSVRDEDRAEVPSQVESPGTIRFLADVPPRAARSYHLCRAKPAATSDLRATAEGLGTGKGTLKVENSKLSVVLSEAAGGTVTALRSAATGRDYGQKSLGAEYGTFSRYDPAKPVTNTVDFIREKKVRQQDSPGRIELVSGGPAAVVARVTWSDARLAVEQVYEFPAGQPYFTLRQKVRPINLSGQQELVAIDAPFQPHRLTKTFPNFVGVPSDSPQPHFGWRQGDWVPPYATLMAQDHFDESISLVIRGTTGLNSIRQGFWPAERPKAGKCAVARIELLADRATGCEAELYVLVHPGHQIVAKRFAEDLDVPPEVRVVGTTGPR